MKIGVLCSGALGFSLLLKLKERYEITTILTDRKSLSIIEFCIENSIPFFAGNPRNSRGSSFLKNYVIDVLISVNYLFLIEEDIFSYATRLSFNIHGALLPKYRGRTPHVWAIINGENETGITAHKIDDGCDTGDIIEQIKIPILSNDTGNDVLLKFHHTYENLVFSVLNKIEEDAVEAIPQDHSLASYFGKRTPEDGKIEWNWQKERIRNWVRAQASPYPGAFSYYKDQKIIIDEIGFSNFGFSYDMPNGLIISISPLLIKTPNGVIEIVKTRDEYNVELGDMLT